MVRKIGLVCLPLLLASGFLFFLPYHSVIAFTFENTNQLLAYLPVQTSDTFQIQYTHSIHLTDVVETYQLKGGQIIQTELQYENFAIGMPSNAEGDEIFIKENGKYFIKNMSRAFPFIDLRIGQVKAEHQIHYEEQVYQLADDLSPGIWVRIQPKRLSLWQQWKGVNIDE
ncbi:DUF1850 domain-containing protein [Bacillus sp. REN10]|uniref:DUF1850 domain-containing protein n=1 Tax=Bacillus sp. REN10 TaxID=2782541 RepID=UPI00193BCBAC|nr:DUF1850 domain-containing protein [Bacillus sp. REN10]